MQRHQQWAATGVAIVAIFVAQDALAGPSAANSPYQAECGACHVAYPPRLLATREWGIVLGHLEQHYGVDASIDDPTLRLVAKQLDAPVTSRLRDHTPLPRITAKAWFVDEHDEVGAGVFRSAAVKSAANCTACHAGADRGDFDEHAVRVPGGKHHD